MKHLSRNKILYIEALLLILPFSKIQAQSSIADWVENQIRGYVDRKINEVTGYNKSTLGSWGSAIWEGVVSAKTESDLKEKMKELNSIEPYQVNWTRISSKYGMNGDYGDYRKIYWNMSDFTKSILYSKHNIPLSSFGNGSVSSTINEIKESKWSGNIVSNLKEILSPTVIDSISYFSSTCKELEETLLKDINANHDIATVLNNHPEAVRVYVNAFPVLEIRMSPAQLLYWGYTADSHREKLRKKSKYLLNPRTFTFSKESNFIYVYHGEDIVAQISFIHGTDKDTALMIDCIDINILNFINMPSATYSFPYMSFDTDRFGRIIKFSQTGGNKNKQKTKFKAKDFLVTKAKATANTPLLLGIRKLGIPETMANTFFIENSNENKITLKQIKKAEKKYAKELLQHSPAYYILEYEDGGVVPSKIEAKFGDQYFTLKNVQSHNKIKQIQPSQSKQEEADFVKMLKQRMVNQQNKEFVLPVDNNSLNNTTKETTTTKTVEQTTPKPFSSDDEEYTKALAEAPSDDDIIREGIKGFLLGKPDAAYLTDRAKADIAESSWPEVQCSVDGTLDSPRSFRNLKVKEVGPRKYKYECTCPKHGDKFVDYCTMEAYLERDGETVFIYGITWDDDIPE